MQVNLSVRKEAEKKEKAQLYPILPVDDNMRGSLCHVYPIEFEGVAHCMVVMNWKDLLMVVIRKNDMLEYINCNP